LEQFSGRFARNSVRKIDRQIDRERKREGEEEERENIGHKGIADMNSYFTDEEKY